MRCVFSDLIKNAGQYCQNTVSCLLEAGHIESDDYGVSASAEPAVALSAYFDGGSCAVDPRKVRRENIVGNISSQENVMAALGKVAVFARDSSSVQPYEDGSAFAVIACIGLSVMVGKLKGDWIFFDSHNIGSAHLGSCDGGVFVVFSSDVDLAVYIARRFFLHATLEAFRTSRDFDNHRHQYCGVVYSVGVTDALIPKKVRDQNESYEYRDTASARYLRLNFHLRFAYLMFSQLVAGAGCPLLTDQMVGKLILRYDQEDQEWQRYEVRSHLGQLTGTRRVRALNHNFEIALSDSATTMVWYMWRIMSNMWICVAFLTVMGFHVHAHV